MRVVSINVRKVLATNSLPTVEIELATEKGIVRSSSPMGTSTGKYESYQMPADEAIRKFHVIRRVFTSSEFENLRSVDKVLRELDQTSYFREIGANLAITISSTFLKAFALERDLEVWKYVAKEYGTTPGIPAPLCNVVGGWKGQSEFQEFLFLPVHQTSFADSVFKIAQAYHRLGDMLKEIDPNFNYSKNLESAWVTSLGYKEILSAMKKIADEYMLKMGLDVAASQIYSEGHYHYRGVRMNSHEQFSFLEGIVNKFPIFYIEDPFQEDDWLSFSTAVSRWQPRIVCGDDFYATRIHRLLSGIDRKAANGAIVKPNQIGTVTDTVEFVKEAQKHGLVTVISHRSGETDENILSHLAVGLGCEFAKFGISGERVCKLNEIIRIEESLNSESKSKLTEPSELSQLLKQKIDQLRF
jgi:enolase